MEDEQVPRGRGDEHLGTVGRQTHPHQVTGVEELLVRAAVFCEPVGAQGRCNGVKRVLKTSGLGRDKESKTARLKFQKVTIFE